MSSRFALSALLAAGAAVAIAAPWSATPAQAYQCKNSPHQAVGVRAGKAIASVAARRNWSATAKTQYGLSWSLWNIATSKQSDCVRLNTGRWRCLASAKPCNYVVG